MYRYVGESILWHELWDMYTYGSNEMRKVGRDDAILTFTAAMVSFKIDATFAGQNPVLQGKSHLRSQ